MYPKHVEFINSLAREKCFLSANRVGKTLCLSALIAYHATGMYPKWYTGKRWARPTKIWVVGATNSTTRDILQKELIGEIGNRGTGMIPKDCLDDKIYGKSGTAAAVDIVKVKHFTDGVHDGYSEIGFKAQEQGFESFVGTHIDFIGLDEEGERVELVERIYQECLIRIMRTDKYDDESEGQIVFTFTPDHGLSPLVERFYNAESNEFKANNDEKLLVNVTWDDVPHLSEKEKKRMLEDMPQHLRDIKTKGIPTIGSGSIFPVTDDMVVIDPFRIPDHFERAFGMDSSPTRTAIVWGAYDPDNDIWYIYDEFYYKGSLAEVIVATIKNRPLGDIIEGVIDPSASKFVNVGDGKHMLMQYQGLGLSLTKANNAVEYGLREMHSRMTTGRLKITSNCQALLKQKRLYRRDTEGRIVNKMMYDVIDAARYLITSGYLVAKSLINTSEEVYKLQTRCPLTGY